MQSVEGEAERVTIPLPPRDKASDAPFFRIPLSSGVYIVHFDLFPRLIF